ncbi:AbrB/MazE/SpoVT family DNA-binding domain-containing protein [Paucibacter sp. TC2R-5]|nr:AbrB/MazE/SpoVT family DNA-binding domain-containing protein [Paucibacter sp. TC2R-5]
MLAKLTSKNQLTLPKSVTDELGPVQYFEVQNKAGQIILTPVRIQRGDALRAKLAELKIDAKTIESAPARPVSPAAKKSGKAAAASKKSVAKPLPAVAGGGRRKTSATTADLKAGLSRAFAKAVK